MSIRLSNSVIVALYRDASCRVEAGAISDVAITGVFQYVSGDSPEDTAISGATACMF